MYSMQCDGILLIAAALLSMQVFTMRVFSAC